MSNQSLSDSTPPSNKPPTATPKSATVNVKDRENIPTNESDHSSSGTWNRSDKFGFWMLLLAAAAFAVNAGLWWSTQINFKTERRAWVGAILATEPHTVVGEVPSLGVVLTNTGQTPALEMTAQIALRPVPAGQRPSFDLPLLATEPSRTVLHPNMNMTYPAPGDDVLTQAGADLLTSGKAVYYVYGIARYQDIFKQPHITEFCFFLRSDLKTMSGCPFHNTAN